MDLTLICPGLFGPIDLKSRGLAPTPALDRLLSRADGIAAGPRDPLETLAGAFGLVRAAGADLPSAALCLLADAPDLAQSGFWLHADPVHLRPDRDRLLLFGGPALGIHEDEATALADAFNAHFRADGLVLAAPRPDRWYLRVPGRPDLRTRPLYAVAGGPVEGLLQTGSDARLWARWQTETQMLFHAHPVNAVREDTGRPTLGGLWVWGGGSLPRVPEGPDLVIAEHPLALGLARAAAVRVEKGSDPFFSHSLLSSAVLAMEKGSKKGSDPFIVVFWDALWWPALEGDGASWQEGVRILETGALWLISALETGLIHSLTIDDGSSVRFQLTGGALRRFWRRRGGFSDWLDRVRQTRPGAQGRAR